MALKNNTKTGDIYKRYGVLYRVCGFQPNPTVILEQIYPIDEYAGLQETHAVGCLNAEEFEFVGETE